MFVTFNHIYLITRTARKSVHIKITTISYREDMYAQDSIDLLQNSGLQFRKHEEDGIEPIEFAELLMTSGNYLSNNVTYNRTYSKKIKLIYVIS